MDLDFFVGVGYWIPMGYFIMKLPSVKQDSWYLKETITEI